MKHLLLSLLISAFTTGQIFSQEKNSPATPPDPAIKKAVEHYFAVWSDADMAAYKACFHHDAIIMMLTSQGTLQRGTLDPFVEGQRQQHAAATVPLKEKPTHIQITQRGNYAAAVVFWELYKGMETSTGVDIFSYIQVETKSETGETKKQWLIASLVFGAQSL